MKRTFYRFVVLGAIAAISVAHAEPPNSALAIVNIARAEGAGLHRPDFDSRYCQRLDVLRSGAPPTGSMSQNSLESGKNASDSVSGASVRVFRFAREEFLWWTDVLSQSAQASVGLVTGTAFHETLHLVRRAIEACAADSASAYYYLDGSIWKIPRVNEPPPLRILSKELGGEYKNVAMRWRHYIHEGNPGNDMYVMIDEFVAYVEAGHFDWLMSEGAEPESFSADANYGGAVDFAILTSAYLKGICAEPGAHCKQLLADSGFRDFMAALFRRFELLVAYVNSTDERSRALFSVRPEAWKEMRRDHLLSIRELLVVK